MCVIDCMNRKSQERHDVSAVRMISLDGSCTSRSSIDMSSNGVDMGVSLHGTEEQEMITETDDNDPEADQVVRQDLADRAGHAEARSATRRRGGRDTQRARRSPWRCG